MRTLMLSVFLALLVGGMFALMPATVTLGVCTTISPVVTAATLVKQDVASPAYADSGGMAVAVVTLKTAPTAGAACASTTVGTIVAKQDVDAAPGLLTLKFPFGTVTTATSITAHGDRPAMESEGTAIAAVIVGVASFTPQSAVLVT